MDLDARLQLSYYETVSEINAEHQVFLVRHRENGRFFVKKVLSVYHPDVYRQLMDNIYNFYLSKHKRRNKQEILAFRHGISDAKKYIKSEEYKSLSSVYCE